MLTSENRTRDAHEPSGEPETLWGRMKGKMGDKALRARPDGLDERKQKLQKKRDANREDDFGQPTKARKTGNMSSVMDLDTAGGTQQRRRQQQPQQPHRRPGPQAHAQGHLRSPQARTGPTWRQRPAAAQPARPAGRPAAAARPTRRSAPPPPLPPAARRLLPPQDQGDARGVRAAAGADPPAVWRPAAGRAARRGGRGSRPPLGWRAAGLPPGPLLGAGGGWVAAGWAARRLRAGRKRPGRRLGRPAPPRRPEATRPPPAAGCTAPAARRVAARRGPHPPAFAPRACLSQVLAVLKNENARDPDRQKECGELLGPVPDDKFAQLVSLGKRITDWVGEGEAGGGEGGGGLDEEIGVAVEFEDEDDEGGEQEVRSGRRGSWGGLGWPGAPAGARRRPGALHQLPGRGGLRRRRRSRRAAAGTPPPPRPRTLHPPTPPTPPAAPSAPTGGRGG